MKTTQEEFSQLAGLWANLMVDLDLVETRLNDFFMKNEWPKYAVSPDWLQHALAELGLQTVSEFRLEKLICAALAVPEISGLQAECYHWGPNKVVIEWELGPTAALDWEVLRPRFCSPGIRVQATFRKGLGPGLERETRWFCRVGDLLAWSCEKLRTLEVPS